MDRQKVELPVKFISTALTAHCAANALRLLATAAVLALGYEAIRPATQLPAVHADSDYSFLFIEPGVTTLRTLDGRGQVQGKVVVDRRNGDIWGFPTNSSAPYPVVSVSHEPPISKPFYLGKLDFEAINTTPKRGQ
jgi:hypothetical protein